MEPILVELLSVGIFIFAMTLVASLIVVPPALRVVRAAPQWFMRLKIAVARWAWRRLPRFKNRIAGLFKAQVVIRMLLATDSGDPADTEEALQSVDDYLQLLAEQQQVCPWTFVNLAVNLNITAGRYRRALELPAQWSREARAAGRARDEREHALTAINLAEALYNLGHSGIAEKLLARVEDTCRKYPICHAGLLVQRAWIATLAERGGVALALLQEVKLRDLPPNYRSEVFFTRAEALRVEGRYAEARQHVAAGLKAAQRASSERNGLFLLGRIALSEGELEDAVSVLERGAAHHYRYQGADGLLALARTYEKLGRSDHAERARSLLIERDPESAIARRLRWANSSQVLARARGQ